MPPPPQPTKTRKELSVSLDIDNSRMELELWRMSDNTLQIEVDDNGSLLTATADTTLDMERLITRALTLFKQVR